MLFAVEGGGFFSSSASGYSKGLALLLLGRKNEERPMRVSPWNQYQLVEQEGHPDLQLATRKNRLSRGCASFICFRRASAGADGLTPPKVGIVYKSEALPNSSSASDSGKACTTSDVVDENERKVHLKSSLKKPSTNRSVIDRDGDHIHDSLEEVHSSVSACTERRRVQWTDVCGSELVQIREFEPSDDDTSDDEFEREGFRRCECVIQ